MTDPNGDAPRPVEALAEPSPAASTPAEPLVVDVEADPLMGQVIQGGDEF